MKRKTNQTSNIKRPTSNVECSSKAINEERFKEMLVFLDEFLQEGPFNHINKGHYLHKRIRETLRSAE